MKSKKVKIAAGLLALTLVAGTLAYFSKTMSIENPFSTGEYGGETVEKFTPEKDWEPGEKITKEVQVKNTGDYDLYVRVKFDEKWERNDTVITGTGLSSADKTKFFPTDANTSVKGGSSVYKHLVNTTGENAAWKDGNDGYYYYSKVLKKDQMTSQLMDYVTLCADADMGIYTESAVKYALVDSSKKAEDLKDTDYTYDKVPDEINENQVLYQKKVISLDSSNAGLAGAEYTLTIKTELLKADSTAATANGWTVTPAAE